MMMSFSRYRSGGEDFMAGLVAVAIFLAALLIAVSVYYAFRAVWLVIRVVWRHPRNRALLLALGACLGAWALCGLVAVVIATGTSAGLSRALVPLVAVLLGIAVVSTVALMIIAKIIELRGDQLFQRELTKETLVEDVLHHPWWEAA